MPAVSADQKVEEPSPEGLKRSHLNHQVLEEFAQNMSENIMESFKSQTETLDRRASGFNQSQETLAEELAEAVIQVALQEVFSALNIADHVEASQPWSPVLGSLDYPDAPPTTPLLPELERSRCSFARKLKGGLAQVYLPSPPPPTPKDGEDPDPAPGAAADSRVEFMEHLTRSLPADDLTRDCLEAGSPRGAEVEAFAEALSCDIIGLVSRGKNREQIADDDDLHLLAQQLSETIITSSLCGAKTLF